MDQNENVGGLRRGQSQLCTSVCSPSLCHKYLEKTLQQPIPAAPRTFFTALRSREAVEHKWDTLETEPTVWKSPDVTSTFHAGHTYISDSFRLFYVVFLLANGVNWRTFLVKCAVLLFHKRSPVERSCLYCHQHPHTYCNTHSHSQT